jgi:DNA-binding LacI/PurR family transcriptional regulator
MPSEKKPRTAKLQKSRATIVDIAKKAGCTPMTVSRILRGLAGHSEDTTQRVKAIAQTMNYRPSILARSLRTQNSRIIACLTPELPRADYISDLFYSRVMLAVEAELARRGYRTLLVSVSPAESMSSGGLDVVEDGLIQSALAVGPHPEPFIRKLRKQLKSLVTVDCLMNGVSGVASSNRDGGWMAARALWEAGHRTFAAVKHASEDHNYSLRLEGFTDFLRQVAGETFSVQVFCGNAWHEEDRSASDAFLKAKSRASAVFCVNDHLAIDFIKGLQLRGVHVPDNVSVCGYDDTLLAAHFSTPLTTIAVDKTEMGKRAVDLLLSQIQAKADHPPVHIEVPVRLLMRQSVAPVVPPRRSRPS